MIHLLVLGTGCPKCRQLAANAAEAAHELGLEFDLSKVTDLRAIAGFGVAVTPALMVDDEIRVAGRVPTVEELKVILG